MYQLKEDIVCDFCDCLYKQYPEYDCTLFERILPLVNGKYRVECTLTMLGDNEPLYIEVIVDSDMVYYET